MRIFSPYSLRVAPLALLCSLAFCPAIVQAADQQAGTATSAPAATAPSAGDIAVPPGLTLDEIKASVLEALAFRKLTVQDQSEGSITASHTRGSVVLLVKIDYTSSALTLTVNNWDSRPKALKTQERWMTNIRKDLTDALVKRKAYKQ